MKLIFCITTMLLLCLTGMGQTNEKLSQLPVVNLLNPGDDIIVNITNGGGPGLYKTYRLNMANLLNSPFFLGSNYQWTGNMTWTSNPQVYKPLVVYLTNDPITFTAGSAFVTAPSGTWDRYSRGMNINPSPGTNRDQYVFVARINATTGQVYPSAQHNYVNDTGCVIYANAIQVTDINGGTTNPFFGLAIDSGGNLSTGDASGSGSAPPAFFILSPALNSYDGGMFDLQGVSGYGPAILTIGGMSAESPTSQRAFFVSTMAPQLSVGVYTNGLLDQEVGRTNVNNAVGGGTLDDFDLVIDHYGLEALPTNSFTGPGTITISSGGHVTGVGTHFLTTFLRANVFTVGGTEYHVNFAGSDTSMFVWENTSKVAGSTYTVLSDASTHFDTGGPNVNGIGTHIEGSEITIGAAVPRLNLAGAPAMWSLLTDAAGNFQLASSVTGTGGNITVPAIVIQPNAPNNSILIESNGAVTMQYGPGSLAVNAGINVSGSSTTNTNQVNMKEFLTGAGVTITNYNNAGTAYLTNIVTGTNVFVDILQPGGITSNSAGLTGHLNPF